MLGVWEIVKIQECRNAGLSKKATAKRLSLDRGTVTKYWDCTDPEREKPTYNRSSKIDPYKNYIKKRLKKWPELSAERIFQEISKMGYQGSSRTVRRYVSKIRPKKKREYKPIETLPGEQAQIDWGHFGEIIENGQRRKLYAFVFCLSWSRVRYVEFITSLNMAVFNGCLHRALQYIGGVPQTILFDNAKTVVAERVGTVIRFNSNLLDLSLAYGFTPKACWVNDPESKGKVESNVKYVRSGFFYAREYKDLEDLNHQARNWLDEIANAKIHGTTGRIPKELLAEEQKYLKDLPAIKAPLPVYEKRKATKTGLISIGGNKYSIPAKLASKTIQLRRYEDRVEVITGNEITCMHQLASGKGHIIINDDHYPGHKKPNQQPPNPLQARFENLAPEAKEYLQKLSQSRQNNLREQMEKIIFLGQQYNPDIISKAMQRSLEFGSFGYAKLKRIMELQIKAPKSLPDNPKNTPKNKLDIPCQVEVERRDTSYYGGAIL